VVFSLYAYPPENAKARKAVHRRAIGNHLSFFADKRRMFLEFLRAKWEITMKSFLSLSSIFLMGCH
jgi:hypothetical protein